MAAPPPRSAHRSSPVDDCDSLRLRELLAQAELRERSLREWVAALVHDLRTPLQSVVGMTEVALGGELDVYQRSCLSTALDGARSLSGIVDGLLDLLRLEDGRLTLECEPFELDELLARSVRTVLHRAHVEGLELELELDPDLPRRVLGDGLRLRQCLVNLLGNAVKFTSEGRVALIARRRAAGGLRLTVEDTGIGLTPEQLERVFEPFEQAEASTARRYGGSGLGLDVTRRLVELMGGRLWAESEVGLGSRFHIELGLESDPGASGHDHHAFDDRLGRVALLVPPGHGRQVLERCLAGRARAIEAYESEAQLICALLDEDRGGFGLLALDERLLDPATGALAIALSQLESRPRVLAVGYSSCGRRGLLDFVDETLPHPIVCAELDRALETLLQPAHQRVASGAALEVLVTDDSEISRRVLQAMLGQLGIACELAGDGDEALDRVAARLGEGQPYDLVLLDLKMERLDGDQAMVRIRDLERERGARSVFLAALSGASREELEACRLRGFDATLEKPVSVETLGTLIARVVERRRSATPAGSGRSAPTS